ncbi:MAG: NAD(P)/FAD-dependent oxidoreductase [Nevskia sp.]
MTLSRRALLQAGFAAAAGWPLLGRAAGARKKSRVIVVGAGFGGATCAKYLRQLSPDTDVLLIERRPDFLTGPFSNLVIAGLRRPDRNPRDTPAIGRAHGQRTRRAEVTAIDPVSLQVTTANHGRHRADRLVVSPGIAMRWGAIEGLDAANSAAMPHAWTGDGQVLELRDRLDAVPDGGTILIGAPPNPYRCPPGPYERASLMAWALNASGRKRCKIVIADAKDDFSKSGLFRLEWDALYPGMIEWLPRKQGGEVVRVDPSSGEVWLRDAAEPIVTNLASIIPPQRAADLAQQADLADESGWCPVHAENFESTRHANVHVLGDAAIAAPMPKSAFAANSQAKLAAAAIGASLNHGAAPVPRLLNTCYSLVSEHQGISVSGYYGAVGGRLSALSEGMSPLSGDAALREREAREALAWYLNVTTDSFGLLA